MKKGIIILCRYSSTRLPGKILRKISGRTILDIIYSRVSRSREADIVVVATSDDSSDDPIAAFCQQQDIPYFRGSLKDVSDRFLKCAKAFELDIAVRINGDNLFADSELIDQGLSYFNENVYDFVTNVDKRTYPTGMSVECVDVDFYERCQSTFTEDDYREHVTLYFYENPEVGKIKKFYNQDLEGAKSLKLAIDTEQDFEKASQIIDALDESLDTASWKKVVRTALI